MLVPKEQPQPTAAGVAALIAILIMVAALITWMIAPCGWLEEDGRDRECEEGR
jgi:hypothetical protein